MFISSGPPNLQILFTFTPLCHLPTDVSASVNSKQFIDFFHVFVFFSLRVCLNKKVDFHSGGIIVSL